MILTRLLTALPVLTLLAAASSVPAQAWTNSGGNAQRNGLTDAFGPVTAQLAWSSGPSSVIAWNPVIADGLVFVVRQTGLGQSGGPPAGAPNDAPVFAMDLASGVQLWRRDIPYLTGQWTTWLLGHSNGRVYAARSGNGATSSGVVHALDAITGATQWTSTATIDAGAYDGCVFADNGDLIVASFRDIWRIRATDGTTVWRAPRQGSVSGHCGAARFGDAVYIADSVPGGQVIKRFDVRDGLGIRLLQQAGLEVAWLSGGKSGATEQRARYLGITHVLTAVKDKPAALAALQQSLGVSAAQCAFVGDDLNDLAVRPAVGLLIATADAVQPLRRRADWVLDRKGGDGAVRRLAEEILRARGEWRRLAGEGWRDRND